MAGCAYKVCLIYLTFHNCDIFQFACPIFPLASLTTLTNLSSCVPRYQHSLIPSHGSANGGYNVTLYVATLKGVMWYFEDVGGVVL